MHHFFETAKQFIDFSAESRESLSGILIKMEFPKGHLLVRQHQVCNYLYYIEKGICRTFYYKHEKDVTDWISMENTFSCSIVSFITRKPDRRNIEVLEDALLWALKYDDLERVCAAHHEIEHFARILTGFGMVQVQQRFDDLHFETATSRYKKLMDTQPAIIQRVPLGMVASYLGVTQETLSRIRSRYS
jgi:CRP-like cAMP-binding protein